MSNKTQNQILNKKMFLLIFALFLLFSTIAFSIPNSLTLQGKLTNLAGASQSGTYNFTFRIYDNITSGNALWELVNYNITTDANGVYDVILTQINLSFAEPYYLGIAVGSDNESVPRINLTSAPYSFRANTSEALNPNQSYIVTNLSIRGNATIGTGETTLAISTQTFNLTAIGNINLANNITLGGQIKFKFGQVIDNLVNGWLKITGGLNVTENLRVEKNLSAGFENATIDIVSQKFNLSEGNLKLSGAAQLGGGLNASGDLGINQKLNVTASSGSLVTAGTIGVSGAGTSYILGNVGIGTTSPAEKLEVSGNIRISGNVSSTNFNLNETSTAIVLSATGSKRLIFTTDASLWS